MTFINSGDPKSIVDNVTLETKNFYHTDYLIVEQSSIYKRKCEICHKINHLYRIKHFNNVNWLAADKNCVDEMVRFSHIIIAELTLKDLENSYIKFLILNDYIISDIQNLIKMFYICIFLYEG